MADNVVVKLTGDEKDLVDSFRKSQESQDKLTKSIGAFGEHARRSSEMASTAVGDIGKTVAELNNTVAKAGRNLAGMPKAVRDEFKSMTKDAGLARSEFERIDDTIDALAKTSNMTEAQLERMRQKLKKTADAAAMTAAAKSNRRNVDSIVRNISNLGPAAQQAVDEAGRELASLGTEGAKSMDVMIAKLRKLGPEGERQADAIERSFKESLDKVEAEFKGPLTSLRRLGDEGEKAADDIKREMAIAGKVSEAAMKRIMTPLNGIGGRVGAEAAKIQNSLTAAAKQSTKSWGTFATKVTAALGGTMVLSQAARVAVDEFNKSLERQAQLRADAKSANRDLATIQAGALQNLTGMSPSIQKDLIDAAPRTIASDTGTGLAGVKELVEAAGVVVSSGVSSPDVIREVMRTSAELNQLSPESISEFAKAVAGALKASGQQDDANAVRNVASGVIAGMKGSGVTDLGQFAATAPRALAAGALASDGGKIAEAVGAFDAMAIAGAASQKTGDDKGDRSSTFAAQMVGKLDEFFDGKIAEQAARPAIIEKKRSELKAAKDSGDSETVGKLSAEIASLQAKSGADFTKAPGTPLSRLQTIHRLKLQDQFKESAGAFGDATFKGVIDDLLRGGSVFQDVMRTRQDITGQMKGKAAGSYAANLIAQQASVQPTTPMNIARASASGESAGELATLELTSKATAQASLDIVNQAIKATEDTHGESGRLLANGYRPNPITSFFGFDGSIERDGFEGGDLQQIIGAQEFLQGQRLKYFKKREAAGPAPAMGIPAFRMVDKMQSEVTAKDQQEASTFQKAIEANQKLFGDLSQFPAGEIEQATQGLNKTFATQFRSFRSDGSVTSQERSTLGQTARTVAALELELSRRNGGDDQRRDSAEASLSSKATAKPQELLKLVSGIEGLERTNALLEQLIDLSSRTAGAAEDTAGNTDPANRRNDPSAAQAVANATRGR
ncbi:hypothetical protein [Planctomycetes bacterium TBK1r]|uniref:Phage-related minor tail protein n=1 Tax=Stieleria magnilauensis TaxID=2527963 RepID=A0ABX5XHG2_9BACT|nr:hypothetical protein TBK1r_03450 [Planctomycetes bacterium TBK1r]